MVCRFCISIGAQIIGPVPNRIRELTRRRSARLVLLLLRLVVYRVLRLVDGVVDLRPGLLYGALLRARTGSERDC